MLSHAQVLTHATAMSALKPTRLHALPTAMTHLAKRCARLGHGRGQTAQTLWGVAIDVQHVRIRPPVTHSLDQHWVDP